MPSESRIRASDADRDHVASLLQEHHAAGRLTAEEFAERMEAALRARTLGELDELLADLPHADLRHYVAAGRLAAPAARAGTAPGRGAGTGSGVARRNEPVAAPGGPGIKSGPRRL